MGYYEGQHENPCPRCGGVVETVFISVAPMSFSRRCQGCGVSEFTSEEVEALGDNRHPFANDRYALSHRRMRVEAG